MGNLAEKLLVEFNDSERLEIKQWAESAYVIRNDNKLHPKDKIQQLYEISWKSSIISKFLKALFKMIKKNGWDDRSLSGRLMLSGATLGALAISGKVGIASSGLGIGVPFWILSSAGGAFLGTIIQELNKPKK